MRIMVADDSSLIRRQVGAALIAAGHSVTEAIDGADACSKLTDDTALIVCDFNMPRMNGLEVLEKMHADRSPTYFILLTTESRPDVFQRARTLGAKAWLIKPFKAELLLATIKKLFDDKPS
jgi:two-component system chemotaxis response regulator CheY